MEWTNGSSVWNGILDETGAQKLKDGLGGQKLPDEMDVRIFF